MLIFFMLCLFFCFFTIDKRLQCEEREESCGYRGKYACPVVVQACENKRTHNGGIDEVHNDVAEDETEDEPWIAVLEDDVARSDKVEENTQHIAQKRGDEVGQSDENRKAIHPYTESRVQSANKEKADELVGNEALKRRDTFSNWVHCGKYTAVVGRRA